MNKIKNFFADWSWKEKAWLAFVLIVQTVAWGIQKESAFMLIMTLTSSLNLVLGAKGKVAGLYFAIINSALYAINCMGIPLYGEVMYNLIYSVVSVVASFLYLLRFSEQWAMWAIVNALSIVMWIMVFMQGDSSALLIIIMKSINFINSTYGFLNWRKIAKENAQ